MTVVDPTRALSVLSPWAWALVHGGKDVENRGPTFTRKFRGRFWVHASKSTPRRVIKEQAEFMLVRLWESLGWMPDGYDPYRDDEGLVARTMTAGGYTFPPRFDNLLAIRGCIIGSVDLHAVSMPSENCDSSWRHPSSLALHVRDPIPLRHPVPAKGGLGLWRPTEAELQACREASHA